MRVSKDGPICKEIDRLIEEGWWIERGGKHNKICHKSGFKFAIPGTPSDHRSSLNWIMQMRRRERQIKEQSTEKKK